MSVIAYSDQTTMRIPREVLDELRKRARALEAYLQDKASLNQAMHVNLAAPPHEQHGVAPWQVIARLLAKEAAYEERKRKSQRRKRNRDRRRDARPANAHEA